MERISGDPVCHGGRSDRLLPRVLDLRPLVRELGDAVVFAALGTVGVGPFSVDEISPDPF